MTDRVKGFVVTLEKDIRIDDVEKLREAISMIKGIAGVEVSISDPDDAINRMRVLSGIREKFIEFYNNELK